MVTLKKLPKTPEKYGPGVLDQEDYEAFIKVVKNKTDKYGPGVLDRTREPEKAAAPPPPPSEPPKDVSLDLKKLTADYARDDGYLSIEDLKKTLADLPEAFDRVFAWEMERNDGPRIGALQHLLKREISRDGGPRPEIIHAIEKALVEFRKGRSQGDDDGEE